ncbi:DUF1684 domain-containing protein [Neolewinella aurantiaca]|uniref:DUF1684 domain-containing protein n=1 Tax=Neolewinella aurantiaca TaxID=2602767 RepID=A0A5C7FJ54_9BACT|nr:DUF1684 domain-containing protein [Neolewinella aurantiaca]TXF89843.1 DUF1684 domain-containing protein [Neolewinella aurantiaca]
MDRYFRFLPIFFALFLLTNAGTLAGQTTESGTGLKNVEQLVDLLFSVEDFQNRFGNALDNNAEFVRQTTDPYFVEILTEEVASSALTTYGEMVGRALLNFNQSEVDSLIAVMQSPYGDVIRKMLMTDNSEIERDLAKYVNNLVQDGIAGLRYRDSLLFEKEFPYDLREVMNGAYVDSMFDNVRVDVERDETVQTETVDGDVYRFKIKWINNSKYSLEDMPGNPASLGDELVVNIYEIEGDKYKYIWKSLDGSYDKHELKRTGFASYRDDITAFRWSLYDQYTGKFTSPLSAEEIPKFKNSGGHQFYEPDDQFRVSAKVEKESNHEKTITLQTSDGREKQYSVYGRAAFELEGKSLSLDLYQPVAGAGEPTEPYLFLPFRDLTSGNESYGGGRYINLDIPVGNELIIDFNKSYNPYCAYTDGYSCPIPPDENSLDVLIKAGIKAPKLK